MPYFPFLQITTYTLTLFSLFSAKFCFGNELGELIHKPPDDYMPLYYFKNDSVCRNMRI